MQEAHSRDWWRATVANWQASGQTAAAFAAGLGVNPKSLPWWQGKFRRESLAARSPAPRFVEVQVPQTAPVPVPAPAPAPAPLRPAMAAQAPGLVAHVGTVRFDVSIGTDPVYVAALLAAVAKAVSPC